MSTVTVTGSLYARRAVSSSRPDMGEAAVADEADDRPVRRAPAWRRAPTAGPSQARPCRAASGSACPARARSDSWRSRSRHSWRRRPRSSSGVSSASRSAISRSGPDRRARRRAMRASFASARRLHRLGDACRQIAARASLPAREVARWQLRRQRRQRQLGIADQPQRLVVAADLRAVDVEMDVAGARAGTASRNRCRSGWCGCRRTG